MTFIEHFSQLASPKIFTSNWIVRIDTHYLGGLRHFNRWEIADIGLLLFFRRGGKVLKSKVCLLQSKRLCPNNELVKEDLRIDYEIGFARLADPEDTAISLSRVTKFNFDNLCRYAAILAKAQQYEAIKQYYQQKGIPVYYQFYNPAFIPFTQTIPLTNYASPEQKLVLGTRIIPATNLHQYLDQKDKGFRPTLGEMKNFITAGRLSFLQLNCLWAVLKVMCLKILMMSALKVCFIEEVVLFQQPSQSQLSCLSNSLTTWVSAGGSML
jgi:hypothetical protein